MGFNRPPPLWLEWPGDQKWPPYWLVRERLKEVEMPLSDDDYVWIHDVVLPTGIDLKIVSKELDEAYDMMMWTIYRKLFPYDNIEKEEIPWFPPQTDEYKDHPINVRLKERRAYLGSLLSQNSQLTDELLQLEKKRKEEEYIRMTEWFD